MSFIVSYLGFHLGSYTILFGSQNVLVKQFGFSCCNICVESHLMSIVVSNLGSHTVSVWSHSVLVIQFSYSLSSIYFGSHLVSIINSYLRSHFTSVLVKSLLFGYLFWCPILFWLGPILLYYIPLILLSNTKLNPSQRQGVFIVCTPSQ